MVLLTRSRPSQSSEPKRPPRQAAYLLAKRVLDVVVAGSALLILSPVMLLIAVAIPLESRGPVFYTQARVGLNRRRRSPTPLGGHERRRQTLHGRPFMIYKFRSMIRGAEEGTGAVWATREDPRVTRVGRIIRRTHLDELPQLWNVILGDMSIVGPRPERPEIVERLVILVPGYERRFGALPGITGLAQVEYCYDHNLQTALRKLQFDLYYLRNGGMLLDVKIMAATVVVMARANGGGGPAAQLDTPLAAHAHGHNGHANGHANGRGNGYAKGHANGHPNGHAVGRVNGRKSSPAVLPVPTPIGARALQASSEHPQRSPLS
jgi:lipopolysaccharide/colanic/teichoic acid biosynthesis glycosyltransferase